ncbi:MAG TPA: RNA polymerase sigma factor [Solirubrobacteraceae bacterium]|nr:RNA polymerase sigma factor [Solirubrobacteraceae bacterium]
MAGEPTALRRSARDPSAFGDFYRAESEALLVFFARRTLDTQIALDLTAETFAQAFAGRARFRGRTDEEARGYLYAIAHRMLARYWRRGRVERRAVERLGLRVPHVTEDDHAAIDERAGLDRLRPAIREQLRRLSHEQQEAVVLRVVEELPYEEIALRLRIPEDAVRARVSRGLRALGPRLRALTVEGGPDD